MVDRRATLGHSVAELTMTRVGHLVGALCAFILLPVLPFLAVLYVASAAWKRVTGANGRPYPRYEPSR